MEDLRTRLEPYLGALKARTMTNREVARRLQVSEAHLSRVLKTLIVKDPAPEHPSKRTEFLKARKEFRTEKANTLSIVDAARAANCSTRTIYRHRT